MCRTVQNLPPSSDNTAEEIIERWWKPYLKKVEICSEPKYCGYNIKWPYKYSDKKTRVGYPLVSDRFYAFKTLDGLIYRFGLDFDYSIASHAANTVWVDINGTSGPNTLCRDVFILTLNKDGSAFVPWCYDRTLSDINKNIITLGHCCAEKIKRDGWQISKDYPW